MITEEQLESLCLDWFREMGWEVLHGADIAQDDDNPLRKDYRQVVLEPVLNTRFSQINPHLLANGIGQDIVRK